MKSSPFPKDRYGLSCCSAKASLDDRELLDRDDAGKLAAIFDMLASDTRLRVLHLLVREDECSPTALAERLGIKVQALCNQLQRLSDRGIVATRRNGSNVFYRVVDPCVIDLIDRGLCLMEDSDVRQPSPATLERV